MACIFCRLQTFLTTFWSVSWATCEPTLWFGLIRSVSWQTELQNGGIPPQSDPAPFSLVVASTGNAELCFHSDGVRMKEEEEEDEDAAASELSGHHRRSYITFAFCERETSSEREE